MAAGWSGCLAVVAKGLMQATEIHYTIPGKTNTFTVSAAVHF